MKSNTQWRNELESLEAKAEQRKEASTAQVGDLLFRFVSEDGLWSDVPLQDSPPSASSAVLPSAEPVRP